MDLPHIDFPVRVAGGHLAQVEQDSAEEIAASLTAILITPRGSLPASPQFGVADPALGLGSDLLQAVAEAAEQETRWEPEVQGIVADGLVWRLSLAVKGAA